MRDDCWLDLSARIRKIESVIGHDLIEREETWPNLSWRVKQSEQPRGDNGFGCLGAILSVVALAVCLSKILYLEKQVETLTKLREPSHAEGSK